MNQHLKIRLEFHHRGYVCRRFTTISKTTFSGDYAERLPKDAAFQAFVNIRAGRIKERRIVANNHSLSHWLPSLLPFAALNGYQ
jgi:hypothetical protein